MVSLYRLKGRALQIGSTALLSLTFFTAFLSVVAVNLLPVIYTEGAEIYVNGYVGEYGKSANLIFSAVFLVLSFGVFSASALGIKRYLLKKAQKKSAYARDIFYFFYLRKFFSAMLYYFKISTVKAAVLLFCLLPCGVCFYIFYIFSLRGVSALVSLSILCTASLLLINGLIFYTHFSSSFFLCDYYFVEGTCISLSHLLACSQRNYKERAVPVLKLRLSFTGWFLLCLLIFPIPYVWGYYNQTLAVVAADFMK